MARIAGINIPMNKHVWVGLQHIYGVGRTRAVEVCVAAGVDPHTRVKDLTEPEVNGLRSQIAKFAVEGDLFVPGHPAPARTSRPRPAYQDQCAYTQGPAQAGRQAERTAGQGVRGNLDNG